MFVINSFVLWNIFFRNAIESDWMVSIQSNVCRLSSFLLETLVTADSSNKFCCVSVSHIKFMDMISNQVFQNLYVYLLIFCIRSKFNSCTYISFLPQTQLQKAKEEVEKCRQYPDSQVIQTHNSAQNSVFTRFVFLNSQIWFQAGALLSLSFEAYYLNLSGKRFAHNCLRNH